MRTPSLDLSNVSIRVSILAQSQKVFETKPKGLFDHLFGISTCGAQLQLDYESFKLQEHVFSAVRELYDVRLRLRL